MNEILKLGAVDNEGQVGGQTLGNTFWQSGFFYMHERLIL